MADLATNTFPFMSLSREAQGKEGQFRLNDACRQRPEMLPHCPVVNLSAHVLSCALIYLTFDSFRKSTEALVSTIQEYLCDSDHPPADRADKGNEIKDRPKEFLARQVGVTAWHLNNLLRSQQLLKTNQEYFAGIAMPQLLTSIGEIERHGRGDQAANGEKQPTKSISLRELMRNCLPELLRFLKKLEQIADKIQSIRQHITDISGIYLDTVAFEGVTGSKLEQILCGRVSVMVEASGIWGGECLRTISHPGPGGQQVSTKSGE